MKDIDCFKYASLVNDILMITPKEEQLTIIKQALQLEECYRFTKGCVKQGVAAGMPDFSKYLTLADDSFKDSQDVSNKLISLCEKYLNDNSDIIVEEAKKELNKE